MKHQHDQGLPGYCAGYHESVGQYLDPRTNRINVPTSVPKLTRRDVMRLGGLTIGSYFLLPCLSPRNVQASQPVTPRGGADNVIMIFLHGGASQMDTFDFKEGPWMPQDFEPKTIHEGLKMPMGLHPKMAERHEKYAIVRSMNFWESEHTRGTYYVQAGRILSPARTHEIPSIGSIVALETAGQRRDSDFLPPFVAMNYGNGNAGLIGSGIEGSGPLVLFSPTPGPSLVLSAGSQFMAASQVFGNGTLAYGVMGAVTSIPVSRI